MQIIYANPTSGGQIRLWREPTKENVITGVLPTFPTCTFYVEGLRSSVQEEDITLKITYAPPNPPAGQPPVPVTSEIKLTVNVFLAEDGTVVF